jgi:hypothetical protein
MDFGHAFDSRNTVAFEQELQNHLRFLDRQVHAVERLLLRFSEPLGALAAALIALVAFTVIRQEWQVTAISLRFAAGNWIIEVRVRAASAVRSHPRLAFER